MRRTLQRTAGGKPAIKPSAVRQKVLLDVVAVGLEQHVGAAQLADLLLGALDHAVALARMRIEDFASAGHLEALFGARFGLDLGHLALLWPYSPLYPPPLAGEGRVGAGRKCSEMSGCAWRTSRRHGSP